MNHGGGPAVIKHHLGQRFGRLVRKKVRQGVAHPTLESGTAVIGSNGDAGDALALVTEVESICRPGADKNVDRVVVAAEVLRNLIHRGQTGTACDADNMGIFRRCDSHAVWATQIHRVTR